MIIGILSATVMTQGSVNRVHLLLLLSLPCERCIKADPAAANN